MSLHLFPMSHTTLEDSRPTTERKEHDPGPDSIVNKLAISRGYSEQCAPSTKKFCSTYPKADSVASCRIMQYKLCGELLRDQQFELFESPSREQPSWANRGAGDF